MREGREGEGIVRWEEEQKDKAGSREGRNRAHEQYSV